MIEEELKNLGIFRNKTFGVGKTIGHHVWFHKDYVSSVMSISDYERYKSKIPSDFTFSVLRWNSKDQELSFIKCRDFDISNEPVIDGVYKVTKKDEQFELRITQKASKNPLVYHHKWLFVKDDYTGFNVTKSKQRSLLWKKTLGVDRKLSSKIGRLDFWQKWLKDNNLPCN